MTRVFQNPKTGQMMTRKNVTDYLNARAVHLTCKRQPYDLDPDYMAAREVELRFEILEILMGSGAASLEDIQRHLPYKPFWPTLDKALEYLIFTGDIIKTAQGNYQRADLIEDDDTESY